MNVGTVGIWSGNFRATSADEVKRHAEILDELGFHALWIPGGGADGILTALEAGLEATSSLAVAAGILSIWLYPARDVAERYAELDERFSGRAVLGLGVSHQHAVEQLTEHRYERPYARMVDYLDELDAAGLGPDDRILAALGPRMLDLARDRSVGAHPYLGTVEHTEFARAQLGSAALLAPEVKVALETDAERARAMARANLERYLRADNYVRHFLRLGWTQDDVANGGSDDLVDELVAWGTEEQIVAHVHAHLAAGADHVAIQVVTEDPTAFPVAEWRVVAGLFADLLAQPAD